MSIIVQPLSARFGNRQIATTFVSFVPRPVNLFRLRFGSAFRAPILAHHRLTIASSILLFPVTLFAEIEVHYRLVFETDLKEVFESISDQFYFSRAFRKMHNHSPTEHRRRYNPKMFPEIKGA